MSIQQRYHFRFRFRLKIEAIITYHGDYEAMIRVCLLYMR